MHATEPQFRTCWLPVTGLLRDRVRGLVGVEVTGRGPIDFRVAPHDSWTLTVQFGRSAHAVEEKGGRLGMNTRLYGVRRWTGAFQGAGECLTLFALLTPLGVVELLQSRPMEGVPVLRASVAALLDEQLTAALEDRVGTSEGLVAKTSALARWLEERAELNRERDRGALRAARAAQVLGVTPALALEQLARQTNVSRRQLERDFARWLGTSPGHWAQVARTQSLSRLARAGGRLADMAAQLGFADQSHMCNAVKQLTGLSPTRFLNAGASELGLAFRAATGGGTVYL